MAPRNQGDDESAWKILKGKKGIEILQHGR